jgi:hypothetical protein
VACPAGRAGLREDTIAPRERLVRRFGQLTNEYPWQWTPGHMDEWSLHLTAEEHPVVVCHEWNTIAHLNDYEGSPEARPGTLSALRRAVLAAVREAVVGGDDAWCERPGTCWIHVGRVLLSSEEVLIR